MVWLIKWLPVFFLISNYSFAEKLKGPQFSKKQIVVGKKTLEVEVAETFEQHSYGLMNRTQLPDDKGMMFVFSNNEVRSFWMKNTFIDLSIGYFDQNKVLFQILDMKSSSLMQKDFPTYQSSGPAQYALEVPKGWFGKHGVKIGDKFNWR